MTQPDDPTLTPAADEVEAMKRIVRILDTVDPAPKARIVAWLTARYQPTKGNADESA